MSLPNSRDKGGLNPSARSGSATPPRRLPNSAVRSREYLTPDEVEKLVAAANAIGRHRQRDALMIMLAYRHGLRVSELVAMRWDQIDFKRQLLYVSRLKKGKPSVHPLGQQEILALAAPTRRISGVSSPQAFPRSPHLENACSRGIVPLVADVQNSGRDRSSAAPRKDRKILQDKHASAGRTVMMTNCDILERLRIDPGKRTLGELSQDREHALHEIVKLRADIERLRTMRTPRSAPADNRLPTAHRANALLRLTDVCELVGVCRSTIYRWMSEGTFPQPVRVGEKAVRWRTGDIERWREAL